MHVHNTLMISTRYLHLKPPSSLHGLILGELRALKDLEAVLPGIASSHDVAQVIESLRFQKWFTSGNFTVSIYSLYDII